MFEVRFDKNANGDTVREYLEQLNEKAKTDQQAKAELKQIVTYMEALQKSCALERREKPRRLEHAI